MLQRDRGQGVVTVSGVVRHAIVRQAHTIPTASLSRRDRNGLVCGFRDDEEPTRAQFTHNCSPLLQVSCQ